MIAQVRPGRQSGFVLVATIWFVAVLALVAVIVAGWLERSLGRASALQDRLAARAEEISAEDEVAYMMLTGYYSPRGLELGDGEALGQQFMPNYLAFAQRAGTPFVALDGRPYRLDKLVLRLQDDHGLFKLNFPDPYFLPALLGEYGVPFDDRGVLIDRLLDYTDKSTLVHLNGATADDYVRAGRPPPRNGPLLTPWEARRVLGWDGYARLWEGPDPLAAMTTIRAIGGLNPNTAPAPVLRALPGMNDDALRNVLHYRQTHLILQPVDLDIAADAQLPVDPMQLNYFPASSLQLTLSVKGDPLVHTIAIRAAPIGQMPFRIDYVVDRPATDADRDLDDRPDVPDLPLPDAFPLLPAKPAPARLAAGR